MSPFSEIVGALGGENLQGIVALIVTALLGKTSWDSYKSKDLVSKSDIEKHTKKLKEDMKSDLECSISSLREEMSEAKIKLEEIRKKITDEIKDDVKKASLKVEKAVQLVENVELKFKSLEERTSSAATKIEGLFNSSDRSRISRAEIRRMKEKAD